MDHGRRQLTRRGLAAVVGLALAGGLSCSSARRADRFGQTFDSAEALAGAVLDALARRDLERLEALPLTEVEFREEVFPEMPAGGHIPSEYAWNDLHQKSRSQLHANLARYGGRELTLERVLYEKGTTAYKTFVVHRKPTLVVRDRESGARIRLALLGSVLVQAGRYKLFSYVADR